MKHINDHVWVLKFQPRTLSEYVCSNEFRKKIKSWLTNNHSHLLFESSIPGSGKTTLSKILAKELAGDEVLFLNASKETSVENIRDKVSKFISTKAILCEQRVVIMDEVDEISPKAMAALKSVLDVYYTNARFIFTCNNISGISDPLKDRCEVVNFNSIHGEPRSKSRQEAAIRTLDLCERILTEENIEYDKQVLIQLIKRFLKNTFNMRGLIKFLYINSRDGVLDESALSKATLELDEIFRAIKNKKFLKVREFVGLQYYNWEQIYTEIYSNCDKYFNLNSPRFPDMFELVSQYQFITAMSPNKEIPLSAFFIQLAGLEILK